MGISPQVQSLLLFCMKPSSSRDADLTGTGGYSVERLRVTGVLSGFGVRENPWAGPDGCASFQWEKA